MNYYNRYVESPAEYGTLLSNLIGNVDYVFISNEGKTLYDHAKLECITLSDRKLFLESRSNRSLSRFISAKYNNQSCKDYKLSSEAEMVGRRDLQKCKISSNSSNGKFATYYKCKISKIKYGVDRSSISGIFRRIL